ncbi:MAG TPA: histidine phosphatase family protein [Labilithrix sp.]
MGSTFLYLARHGETADNAALVFQGQSGKGLNALGRTQAKRLGQRLARRPPDAVIASDLERAVETATIVAEACGREVELDPDLREVDVGHWTGKDHLTIAELFPEEWAAWSAGLDVRRGGGETYAELADRVTRALERVVAKHEGKRVLVVSHGGAIKSVVARLLGVGQSGFRALAGVANAGITLIERDASARHRLHSWNDTAHLEGLVVDEQTD